MEILVLDEEVAKLEVSLLASRVPSQLLDLLELSWHLRQRDAARAISLASEVEALSKIADIPHAERNRILGRLDLIRGEVKWLFAELDVAEATVERALLLFKGLDDAIGCADAHWLLALIIADRSDPNRRDAELELALADARRAGDSLRSDLMEATMARFAVFRDLHNAQARWGTRFGSDLSNLHPGLATWVYDYLGLIAFQISDFESAATYRLQMYENAMITGQVQRIIIAATNVGCCFNNLNDYQGALEWMKRGLEMARPTGWPASIGLGLIQTADTLRHLGRLKAAHDLLLEALTILIPLSGSRTYAITLEYMGDVALDRGDYIVALDTFLELERRATALNQSDIQTIALRGQSHAQLHLGRPEEALAAGLASLALAVEQRNGFNQIDALRVLAQIHAHHSLPISDPISTPTTAPTAALYYLNRALDVAATIDGYTVPGSLLDEIAREHANIGDTAQAYAIAVKAIAAREKTNSADATNRAAAMQISHQTERAHAEAQYHQELAMSEAKRAEALQQTSLTLERLSAIGQEITAHLDANAVFQTLYKHVHGLLDAMHFSIFLMEPDGVNFSCAFGIEDGQPLPALRGPISHPSSNVAKCARERVEVIREQASQGYNPNQIPGTRTSSSALFFPLTIGQRLLGVMSIQSPQTQAYAERERLIFRTLCAYGAIALENATAYRQLEATLKTLRDTQSQLVDKNIELEHAYREQQQASLTDPLTGLRNRRFLLQHIDNDVAMTLRRNKKRLQRAAAEMPADIDLVFFMIDIDHFKLINDKYGHAAGDLVLVQMRERLQKVARETDYIIRWGGEEFLLVARGTDRSEAKIIAERLRAAVSSLAFDLADGVKIAKTCSVGFACFPFLPEHPRQLSWSQVVELADIGLYHAKQSGRDAWVGMYATMQSNPEGLFHRITHDTEQALRSGEMHAVSSVKNALTMKTLTG
ncbi:diguanylate cyclase (GGDEF)-like protein [Undibacterium sp. GrIS 1.8]|uniref:sensor domain-containing diguanylate cyclase n=1 Tax=Undibacterium sp. GrIS 1.8 TaxID=3143934 RepID=UPI00339B3833